MARIHIKAEQERAAAADSRGTPCHKTDLAGVATLENAHRPQVSYQKQAGQPFVKPLVFLHGCCCWVGALGLQFQLVVSVSPRLLWNMPCTKQALLLEEMQPHGLLTCMACSLSEPCSSSAAHFLIHLFTSFIHASIHPSIHSPSM